MGVKGLLSLLQACPDACRRESIKKLAENRQSLFGCDPILVVDGLNFISWLYTSREYSLECIYGGQWIQFRENLAKFVLEFEEKCIKLVFIFDGTICKEKLTEWANRRMFRYEQIAAIFDDISQNLQTEVISRELISPALKVLGKYALKDFGVDVYQTDKEVDANKYIADFANKNEGVFAILSDNTDFIIFDTKPMLSISQLKLDTFTTVMYDRYFIAEHYLKISLRQLPLFACLMGNDYVPFDENLKKFHYRLAKHEEFFKKAKVRNLCMLIRQKSWTGDFTNEQELRALSREAFGHENHVFLFKRGLESYDIKVAVNPLTPCVNTNPHFAKAVHEMHLYSSISYIYNLLCKKEYGSSEVLEDGSRNPSALIYREIRQRCYGLLFNCFVNRDRVESIVVEERCWYKKNKYENNDLNKPEKIHPLPLRNSSDVMRIEDLWLDCTENRRFEFFWHVLQIPMEFDLLMKLPEDKLALSCILNYLISRSEPLLQPLDVAVFVAQAAWEPNADDIEKLENPEVSAPVVNLSTLFVCGIEAILMALETCGFTFPFEYVFPWRFFDGKLFHFLYNKAKRHPRVWALCNDQEEIIERFYQLLPVVTDNTAYDPNGFEWRNILTDFWLE